MLEGRAIFPPSGEVLAPPSMFPPKASSLPLVQSFQMHADFDSSTQYVLLELFGGILPCSLVTSSFPNKPLATYFSEIDEDALAVITKQWPEAVPLGDIRSISLDVLAGMVSAHPEVTWVLTGGPPCTDVSLLKDSRDGAFGPASILRDEFKRIYNALSDLAQGRVYGLMECTPMDDQDKVAYDAVFGSQSRAFELCSSWWAPVTRKRWWWVNFQPIFPSNVKCTTMPSGITRISFIDDDPPLRVLCEDLLQPGWWPLELSRHAHRPQSSFNFSCLTRHKAKLKPLNNPRGLERATAQALQRWRLDEFAQSPYQYADHNVVCNLTSGKVRRLVAYEEEKLSGYPPNYTLAVKTNVPKDPANLERRRKSLLGNAWTAYQARFWLLTIGLCANFRVSDSQQKTKLQQGSIPHLYVNERLVAFLEVYNDLKLSCPYRQDRLDRGLDVQGPLGPGQEDLFAHLVAAQVFGLQGRKDTTAVTHKNLIPLGLPPELHWEFSKVLRNPLEEYACISDDMDFALRTLVSQGSNISRWRKLQMDKLRRAAVRLKQLEAVTNTLRSKSSRLVASHIKVHHLDPMRYSVNWPDGRVGEDFLAGFAIVDHLSPFGIFREKHRSVVTSKECLLASADEWNTKLSKARPPRPEEAKVAYDKTVTEQRRKHMGPFRTKVEMDNKWGKGMWRALKRFALWQINHGAWRVIDNGNTSETNDAFGSDETIHTTNNAVSFAVLQRLRQLVGVPLMGEFGVLLSSKDMKGAYRQMPVLEAHSQFSIICVYVPSLGQWMFCELWGLAFGLASAVIQFNRFPTLLCALARRWLALPLVAFFDDFKLTELVCGKQSGWSFLAALIKFLGPTFDPEKDSLPSTMIKFLGNVEDLQLLPEDKAYMYPSDARRQRVKAALQLVLSSEHLPSGTASSVLGQLVSMSGAYEGRVGRGQLHFLRQRTSSVEVVLSEELKSEINFQLHLVDICPKRCVRLVPSEQSRFVVYTDASYGSVKDKSRSVLRLGWVVLDQLSGQAQGWTCDVPTTVMDLLPEQDTYIAYGEAFAPLLCLLQCAEVFKDSSVLMFIDNMGVLCSLVLGHSRAVDLSLPVYATILHVAQIRAKVWFEYVDSCANVADGPSRDGVTCPVCRSLNIPVQHYTWPVCDQVAKSIQEISEEIIGCIRSR